MGKYITDIVGQGYTMKFIRFTLDSTREPYRELWKNKSTDDLKEMYSEFLEKYKDCSDAQNRVELRTKLGAIEELLSGRHNKIERQLINEKTDSGEVASQIERFKVFSTASLKLQHHILRGEYLKTAMDNTEQRAKLYTAMTAIHEVLSKRTEKELEMMTQEANRKYGSRSA